MLSVLHFIFLDPLELLMRLVLEWGFSWTHSWGWSLLLLSLVVNTAILPIYNWAERRQEEERDLRRSMARHEAMLRECFKGQERFALMSALRRFHGDDWRLTLRASVGLALQIPFFLAAYRLLSEWTPFNSQSFGPLADLAAPDGLLVLGNFSVNLLPFAMTAVNLLAALVHVQNPSPRDWRRMFGIALLFLVLLYSAPSALVLYWTLNNAYALCKSATGRMNRSRQAQRSPYENGHPMMGEGTWAHYFSRLLTTFRLCLAVAAVVWLYGSVLFFFDHPEIELGAAVRRFAGQCLLTALSASCVLGVLTPAFRHREAGCKATFSVIAAAALFALQIGFATGEMKSRLVVPVMDMWNGWGAFLFALWTVGAVVMQRCVTYLAPCKRAFIRSAFFCLNRLAAGQRKIATRTCEHEEQKKCWQVLCFALSFMLCIFAPLTAYYANSQEFWFSLLQLLSAVLTIFFIFWLFLLLVTRKFVGKEAGIILFGLLLVLYLYLHVQGNYIPRDYGLLDGSPINWSKYKNYEFINIVNILFFLLLFLTVTYKMQSKIYILGKFFCYLIITIQSITLILISFLYYFNEDYNKNTFMVSTKGMLEFSKNKNIIIFIMDAFDSSYMQDLLSEDVDGKIKTIFSDFTFYQNTVGAYPFTLPSLPFILTGNWWEYKEDYAEYLKESYGNQQIYRLIRQNNYTIGLYTDQNYIYPVGDYFDNVLNGAYGIKDFFGFTSKIYQLVAFNYCPHWLKKYFYLTSSEFDNFKKIKSDFDAFSMDDLIFHSYLINNDIKVVEHNIFHLYHLNGVHSPYRFGEDLQFNSKKKYTAVDAAKGSIALLSEFIKKLKDMELYENSSIIVMADHGKILDNYTELNFKHNPIFMLKQSNFNHDFYVSDAKMGFEFLNDIFIDLVNDNRIDDNLINNYYKKYGSKRRFLWWSSEETQNNMVELYFLDNIKNEEHIIPTGNYYIEKKSNADIHLYDLGNILDFSSDNNYKYCIFGFSPKHHKQYITSCRNYALMRFVLHENHDDLIMNINFDARQPGQHMEIFVNNNLVASFVAKSKESRSIPIANHYIKNNEIILMFHFFKDGDVGKDANNGIDIKHIVLSPIR